MDLVPVILCGGSGTRLWPLSRAMNPKQLLQLTSGRSLLQETLARLDALDALGSPPPAMPIVVCNEAHRFLVAAQLRDMGRSATVMLEPEGRNTAPAIAVAARHARQRAGHDVRLLVLPADHVITDVTAFAQSVEVAMRIAAEGRLVTFGITPTRPETGYGYIAAEAATASGWHPVRAFVEKPDYEMARRYVQSGDYLWNSGMFLFSADMFLGEVHAHAGDIAEAAERSLENAVASDGFIRLDVDAFTACRADSVDYAVMERSERVVVVPLDAGWSDVGSWDALWDASPHDESGNVVSGDVVLHDCRDSLVRAESRLVAVAGVKDCIVVETADAVLVVPRGDSQVVRQLVGHAALRGRDELRCGREVFRPWGSFESLGADDGFQVKRLTILPGGVLSLQLHHHRAEHWVVVAGRARVTRDDEILDLGVGEHVFIPLGARHRIENPGQDSLVIVEVQVGGYLGEDDIVRFEDRYGREGRRD